METKNHLKNPHKYRTSWHKEIVHKEISLCTFELVNAQGSAILLRTREVHKDRTRVAQGLKPAQ